MLFLYYHRKYFFFIIFSIHINENIFLLIKNKHILLHYIFLIYKKKKISINILEEINYSSS
jgi:hypothetical protein